MAEINVVKGSMVAKGKKFGIAISRFNEFVSSRLLEGAQDTLIRLGAKSDDICAVWVPGAFELPMAAKRMASSGKYDAVICLGAIIRGETPHFDFVAAEAAKGIASVAMGADVPCVFGVITADNLDQAIDRAGTKSGNKGRDAAMTAVEMTSLYSLI
ncbi:MAG TPA: 6,7-dimethyl-8-ribityllumazine synthase [Candidatus Omnitrophota bacterium]|nr:6,7-dimethyl-8-ribityllumazine synthase [Candidatus Omnitrophota bacterium]